MPTPGAAGGVGGKAAKQGSAPPNVEGEHGSPGKWSCWGPNKGEWIAEEQKHPMSTVGEKEPTCAEGLLQDQP